MAPAAPTTPAAAAAALLGAIRANRIVNYAAIGSAAILVFDYCLTLPAEVQYMWPTALSVPKVLFFILRYFSFIHTTISMIYRRNPAFTGTGCVAPFYMDAFSSLTAHTVCEAISYVRVYAFAGRSPILLGILSTTFLASTVLQYFFLAKFSKTVRFANIPTSARIGCVPIGGDNIWLSIVFKLILANIVVVTCIMMYTAYRSCKNTRSAGGLLRLFYRDGIFHFAMLSTLAITNIIFDHVAPPNGLQFTMVQIQVHLNAVITTRMLLHLRQWASRGQRATQGLRQPHETGTALGELEYSGADSKASWRAPQVLVQVRRDRDYSL